MTPRLYWPTVASPYPRVLTCLLHQKLSTHSFEAKILYAPGKAANAGGVSVSGLEMTQNAQKLSWSSEEVDQKLQSIMENIHEQCVKIRKARGWLRKLRERRQRSRLHEGS